MQTELDRTDRQLLSALQDNARLTSGELAQMAHLSQSPCWRRVKRLEEDGVIAGYHASLNRRALGLGVMVFVMIGIDHQTEASSLPFEEAVCAIPEVVMFHGISGPEDFMLVVVTRDLDAYSELLQNRLHRLPGVRRVHSYFSLQEFKGRIGDLPVP
ncbi:Lrp/AsnC family transcriptional regulator [Paracidovorax avenae]|uniref:Transcriptional regulator, AsnC family n=1 Tax=Paracidovorax avenae (strain ATCC 19860 / DSM 7227 / CCUG 15838 / JCM 20985 / LMG 2117 / NCPPB 1011) TaxID=643561 RepID=F0QCU8_PARA1|nr:Lrp/AsnC family transcriptional regulator [Paracidovorax avenae]ADX45091.1 transcriptional regulator, AsnC family [Paracidovorax avenae ATCC 19860]AVS64337.1 Lrp/AsnC family transcriptional regulator [Paracidovorax avenae]AVS77214.1 Lrp/AsnC family transcriptional regulator [Paracidovorax avenae]AVS80430.1 Lrp/AsnC family transcriptional regulator [Paracidovorax avenae]AVS98306.1 Lrp/AsnC family transcriptional regulator [Paracidovorax avenae]